MATEIYLVKVGMSMTEGVVEEWYIADGDRVETGELLYRLETEKVNLDVDAEASGTVKHLVGEGITMAPGDVVGFSEIAKTASPGATWPQWKNYLLTRMQALMAVVPRPAITGKPIEHYMLLWHKGSGNWAEWDMRGALDYFSQTRQVHELMEKLGLSKGGHKEN